MMPSKIIFIVHKATSELDFFIPLVWKLKQNNPNINIKVLYSVINKKSILRKASFYSNLFKEINIKEYDVLDLLFPENKFIKALLSNFFYSSYWDGTYCNGIKGFYLKIIKWIIKNIENNIFPIFVSNKKLATLKSEIWFFPLRVYHTPFKDKIFNYILKNRIKTILYPQGAFPSTGSYKILFGKKEVTDKYFPNFMEIWYSFCKENTKNRYVLSKKYFHYVGYPGLDSEWLNFLKNKFKKTNDEINCLFIIRKFVKNNKDPWVFDYSEFSMIAKRITSLLSKINSNIKLIIKPHPSNDFRQIECLMQSFSFKNYKITHEPIYQVIAKCDFAISISSTVMLVPEVFGIPVIFLNSSVKKTFELWPPMKELFGNLNFYVDKIENLNKVLLDIFNNLDTNYINNKVKENIVHFRNFYPDNSLEVCLKELNKFYENGK